MVADVTARNEVGHHGTMVAADEVGHATHCHLNLTLQAE